MRTLVYIPKSKRLSYLFELQTGLVEHKFPKDHVAEHEFQISNAGDIFRAMTGRIPDCGYIGQKLESLRNYLDEDYPPIGDFREFKELMLEPYYKPRKEAFLRDLQKLKEATKNMFLDATRKKIMLEALSMIEALIAWFESLNPHRPPKNDLTRLINAVNSYCMR